MKTKELPYLKEERQRNIKLTNMISLAVVIILVVIASLYLLFNIAETERLVLSLLGLAVISLIPYLLNKAGYENFSRVLLSTILPVGIMVMSIDSKLGVIDQDIINPVNYFDVRIALLNSIIVPVILFSAQDMKWLLISLIPSVFSIFLFDPIHNYFGVGYYQSGMISPDYYFSANLYTVVTLVFIGLVILFLKRQVLNSDYRQTSENEKIREYITQMIDLSNSDNINYGKVDATKKEILKAAQSCLQTTRVSIWSFNRKLSQITCDYLLEDNYISSPGTVLSEKDYPKYFAELKLQRLVIASDAKTHNATSEFTEGYLSPLSIYSMMDAPYQDKGNLGGVICLENQFEYKQWGPADSLLLKALADFLSYSIIAKERITQNQLLKEKNEEISTMNENLESLVMERTQELEKKNKQLTEYAYINSHILRAPVARISGLYNLFKMENSNTTITGNSSLIDHMSNSISELEQVTYQINRAIEEHGNINRTHLKK